MRIEELGFAEWEGALPKTGFEVFHTTEALRVIDNHESGELRLFGGFKGQQPVGLLPIFIKDNVIGRIVSSPPLGFGIRRMGPILMPTSPKQRKREKVNRAFTEEVLEAVNADKSSTLFYMSCIHPYADPRPYSWAGLNVEPYFTYRLNLKSTTLDDLLKSFSKSLRREIRDGEEADISIRTEGIAGARTIYDATEDRFEEQGMDFPLSWEFMRDLLDALDDHARAYVAESAEGEFLSGIVVLYSNDTAYFWKGGARKSHGNLSVNTLLHWRIIKDIMMDPPRESISHYDFYTANNERITRYKSKFGGELVPYYRIESAGIPMAIAKKAYRTIALKDYSLYQQRLRLPVPLNR